MKNILLTLIAVFSLFLFVSKVSAVSLKAVKSVVLPVPVVTVTKIDYTLPYPGLLPNSPLYTLKQIRDKILEFLINDPVRKIEFYLLQADKRLAMGIALLDKKESALAESTISKGEKYMSLAVGLLSQAKSAGVTIPGEVVDRLGTAIAKHMEVLNEMILKESGAVKTGLEESLKILEDLQQQIVKFK